MKPFENVALRSYVQMAKQAAAEAWREKARQHGEPEEGLGEEFDAWWDHEFGAAPSSVAPGEMSLEQWIAASGAKFDPFA